MELLPFLAVAVVVVVTPGVDMALVTRNALVHGRQSALATALGINLGIAFWSVAAALGLAAVVATSGEAFTAVKLAGAAYLIYLGVQALRSSRGHSGDRLPVEPAAPPRRAAFRQGLVSNLLNPKIAVFFTSLLPQFVGTDGATAAQLLFLGGLFNVMGIAWLSACALVVTRAREVLGRRRVRAAIDRISGIVLIGLGVRLVLDHRR